VISGEGNMEENVYRHFVDVNRFIDEVKSLLAAEYDVDVKDIKYTIPDGVDENDFIEVADNSVYYTEDGTILEFYGDMVDIMNSEKMLKCSPDALRFDGNVTSISDGAFFFCSDLTEITLPPTIKTIGDCAFAHCTNLTSIALNEGLESIGADAFMNCINLKTIDLPTTLEFVGSDAFITIAENSVINCPTAEIFNYLNTYTKHTEGRTTVSGPVNV
ncbi:MAG: leucine-rich repeat domain-containing protein, partial [Clostridium sp.]|nr:leucine-rich repeat domain-containing protein [Clostridium sp.]